MANEEYGAIKLSDANAVGAMLVKKMGGSGYAPKDWAEVINLMGALPEKTVSGGMVHIEDGADDVPVRALTCTVNPNLSGVSSINLMQTKKNLIKPDKYQTASNNLALGQTDGTSFGTFLKAGTYTISYTTSGETCYIYRRESNDSSNTNMGKKLSATFTLESEGNFRFWLYGDGAVLSNISNVQIEVGSSASTYSAYETPTQYTASLGRTIYGGTADVITGEGVDGYGYIVFDGSDDETWYDYANYEGYSINISTMKVGNRQDGVCNQLTRSTSSSQGQSNVFWLGVNTSRFYVIGVYQSMGSTLEAFKAYLAENPLILVYPLATETPFTFTPITPTPHTALGTNNLWNNMGDSEVTYRRDIDLALNSGSSLLGFGLGNPNAGQESEE